MVDLVADGDRLAALEAYALMDTPPEAHFDAIVEQAAEAVQAPISLIALIDDRRRWLKAKLGVDGDDAPFGERWYHDTLMADDLHVVPDALADDRYRDLPEVSGEAGIRFYAGVPLIAPGGARLGTLCVIDMAARDTLDEEARDALTALARRTVAAFELRREVQRLAGPKLLDNAARAADAGLWLDQASILLAKASAALDQVGSVAGGALAQLENVIVTVDTLRRERPAVA